MRREPQNMVLLLFGVSVAFIAITGAFTRYVRPTMLPWLLVSAVVLVALALSAVVRDLRARGASEHCGHSGRGGIVWLLSLPIVMLSFVVPPALSPGAAAPSTVPTNSSRPFAPLPAGRAPAVPLPEVLMRIAAGSIGGLDHKLITITGFTMRDGDRVDLAKIVIICCAADAQLARLHLAGPTAQTAAGLPDNTWVQVEGMVRPGQKYSGVSSIPTFNVSNVVRTDPPANTYGA